MNKEISENEINESYNELEILIEDMEFKMMLSKKEDSMCAILQITAGAGGTESCDWAEMLLRMYLMWGEKNNFKIKELNIPVIALSQLSRAVETRGGTKRPILSDLRESGAIEQDADIVSFLYRPEYYGITEWDDDMKTPSEGQGEFIVAKHRTGALDSIKLKFVANLGKFEDIDSFDSPFEFQSKLNTDNKLSDFSEPSNKDDDEDVPF